MTGNDDLWQPAGPCRCCVLLVLWQVYSVVLARPKGRRNLILKGLGRRSDHDLGLISACRSGARCVRWCAVVPNAGGRKSNQNLSLNPMVSTTKLSRPSFRWNRRTRLDRDPPGATPSMKIWRKL